MILAGLTFTIEEEDGFTYLVARNESGEVGRTSLADAIDQARQLAAFTYLAAYEVAV